MDSKRPFFTSAATFRRGALVVLFRFWCDLPSLNDPPLQKQNVDVLSNRLHSCCGVHVGLVISQRSTVRLCLSSRTHTFFHLVTASLQLHLRFTTINANSYNFHSSSSWLFKHTQSPHTLTHQSLLTRVFPYNRTQVCLFGYPYLLSRSSCTILSNVS